MRKSIFLLISLSLFLSVSLGAEVIRVGVYCDYFAHQNALFQQVYGKSGDLQYGFRLGIPVIKGFQASFSYGQYKKFGTTTELNDVSRVTFNPLTAGIRYTAPLGRLNPFVEIAYLSLSFSEESDIGNHDGNHTGWMALGGFEFLLSDRFGMTIEIMTHRVDGPIGSDGQMVSFSGIGGGLGFFVRL
jgi:hypothetical protein